MVQSPDTLLLERVLWKDIRVSLKGIKMKKLIISTFILLIAAPSFAAGIGYIDYEKVFANYQYAKTSAKEIEAQSAAIQQFLTKKEAEFNKLETPLQKKKFEESVQAELKAKEVAFNSFREKREEAVYTRIHAVTEKIRLEKGYDAILDSRSVFSGGQDVTDILIQKLNEHQR